MQKITGKRQLSLLLVFAMLFSLIAVNQTITAYGLANGTLDDAIADLNLGAPASVDQLLLSGTDIVGEVDVDELKGEYPFLVFLDLSHTNVTEVTNTGYAGQVVYNLTDTIASGDRQLYFDNIPVEYSKAAPADITVGEILDHIRMRGKDDANNTVDIPVEYETLIDTISLQVMDSVNMPVATPGASSSFSGFDAATRGLTALTANALNTLNVGEAYTVEVTITYQEEYNVSNFASVMVDLEVLNESLDFTSTLYPDTPYDYGYITNIVTFYVEKLDEYGNQMDITSEADFDVQVSDGSVTVPATKTVRNGRLEIEFDTDGFSTGTNWNIFILDLVNPSATVYINYDFEMRAFASVSSAYLSEYNSGSMSTPTYLSGTNTGSLPVDPQPIFIRQGSATSSEDASNLAEGTGTYGGTTRYIVSADLAYLTPDKAGMIRTTYGAADGYITVTPTKQTVGGTDYLALEIRATASSTVGTNYDIIIHVDDRTGGPVLDIPINCRVVAGDVSEYAIYQVPTSLDSTIDLEELINNSPDLEAEGIYLISHSVKGTAIPPNPAPFVQDVFNVAEITENASSYLVATANYGASSDSSIIGESSITKWYDYGDSTLTGFGTPPAPFATNSDFAGAEVTGRWSTKAAEIFAGSSQAVNPDARVGLVIYDGSQNTTMTADVTIVEKQFDGYVFVDADYVTGTPLSDPSVTVYSSDEIHIGLAKGYRILKVYDNGSTELFDLSDFTNTPKLSNTSDFTLTEGPSGEAVIQVSDEGGLNDELAGQATTLTIIDQDGVESKLEITVGKSVITGFTYYIESHEVKTIEVNAGVVSLDTASVGLVSETDNATMPVKLLKGPGVQMYLVPEFSNADKNDDIINGSGWQSYKAYPEDFTYVGFNEDRPDPNDPASLEGSPATTYTLNGTADGAQIGVSNYSYQDMAPEPNVGDNIRLEIASEDEIRLAYDVFMNPAADGYRTYDLSTKQFDVNLEAEARFVIGEPYMEAMDAEWYTDDTKTYKTYHSLSANNNEISGAANAIDPTGSLPSSTPGVGEEIRLRVKVAYSDAEHLDESTERSTWFTIGGPHPLIGTLTATESWVDPEVNLPVTLDSFKDGVWFMSNSISGTREDHGEGYDPQLGPVAPGAIPFKVTNTAVPSQTEQGYHAYDLSQEQPLDVLRSYYASAETYDYLDYIISNPDGIFLLGNGGRDGLAIFDYGKPAGSGHDIVMAEMNKIQFHVLDAAGNDVAAAMNAGWSTEYPGIFTMTPHQIGTYRIIFYQDYTLDDGTVVQVPMEELVSLGGNYYVVTLGASGAMTTEAEEIALVGDYIYFDPTATNTSGGLGEYVVDTGLPSTFYIYPVIKDNSFTGTSLDGFLQGDIASTPGVEYMYAAEFPSYASELDVVLDNAGGTGSNVDIQCAFEEQTIGGKDVIAIKVTAAAAYRGAIRLEWPGGLTYASGGAGYVNYSTTDPLNVLASGVAGDASFYYRADVLNLVYDISIGNTTTGTDFHVDRSGSSQYIAGNAADPVQMGETVGIEVGYQLNSGARPLFTDELAYVNSPSASLPANALLVMPDAGNPGTCTVTGSTGSASTLAFTPSLPGEYKFILSTVNTQGAAVPQHAGTRTITFTVSSQFPDYTITYGDVTAINWGLPGLVPTYSIQSESPAGLLDATALGNGLLKMTSNLDGSAVIEVKDDTGVSWGTFQVTMNALSSGLSRTLVPNPANVGEGDTFTIREKVTYANGTVEYYPVTDVRFNVGTTSTPFLSHSGDGVMTVNGVAAGAVAGSVNYYDVDAASGTAYHGVSNGFRADYTGGAPALNYPTFAFPVAQLTLQVGETAGPIGITSADVPAFTADELFLSYSGSTASIVVAQQNSFPGYLDITGIAPGTVTIYAADAAGRVTGQMDVIVVSELAFSAHPQDVTVMEGSTASFTAATTGGDGTVDYKWQSSTDGIVWTDIPSSNSLTLSVANVTAAMDGLQYRCVAEDLARAVESRPAALTVTGGGGNIHTISGSIIDSASAGIGGATVILLDGSGVELSRVTSASGTGNYSFANLANGNYTVVASAPLYTANTAFVPVQGADCTGVNITLQHDPGNTGGHTVYGRVTDGTSGLSGATVELVLAGNTEDSATTDSAGWYAFAGVTAGTYSVQASLSNYISNSITSVAVAADTLISEIALTPVPAAMHSISGTVTDDAATPNLLTGATLDVYQAQTGTLAGTATTSAGVYTVTGLPSGNYVMIASAANHQPQIKAVKIESSNVAAIDFALKQDSTVTGDAIVYGQITSNSTPPAALSNATVTLKSGTTTAATATTGSDGYYIAYDVQAGTYDITASRTSYDDKTESVIVNTGDTVVRHDLQLTASSTQPPGGNTGGGSGGGGTSYTAELALEPTTIDIGEEATAEVSRLLSGSNTVTIASNARFTWTVSDDSIARIESEDGKAITLIGLTPGTTTIRVSVVNSGQTYTGSTTLTVRGEEEFAAGGGFTDVPESFWGYDAITYLAEKGIVSGYEDGTFLPNNAILRNEFAVMLANSMEWETATSAQLEAAAAHFADWSEIPAWAQSAWALAYANDVMAGNLNGGVYCAEGGRNISRQEVSVVFDKLLGTNATAEIGFSDAGEIASWALAAVQECVAEGLISGYEDNTFRPTANITRAETATIFYQYLTK